MLFTTIEFAVFFLFILGLNWALKGRGWWYRLFLLGANFFFYGTLNKNYLPLLLAAGLFNWLFARLIVRAKGKAFKKLLLAADVALNLGLLAFFKYFEFFYGQIESLLLALNLTVGLAPAELPFPVGISFFTFMGLSYAIDVYRDHQRLETDLLDVLLFVSFFPTVLSGPIMRADRFIPQLEGRVYEPEGFQEAFALILSGLFKKIVIASYLSEHIVRQVFQVPEGYSSLTVLAAVYSYSIQIYCDFSGYTDLAMGLALLLGFRIPQNFRQPYTALNLQEFWRRWHISLSTWLRDYLYIPLGGNRKGLGSKYLNLMITMVLGGLWHGAHTRFLLWGFLHGLGLTVTHMYVDWRGRRLSLRVRNHLPPAARGPDPLAAVRKFLAWFFTFHFVSFLWVFFRADDAGRAFEVFRAVFCLTQPGDGFELLVIPAVLAGLLMQFFGGRLHGFYLSLQSRLPIPLQGVTIALLGIIILKMGPEGVLPFIYFQF
ncbi:MAG: MBOAT family O-acyltransferase [Thermodesulfobacteriota bacterium]